MASPTLYVVTSVPSSTAVSVVVASAVKVSDWAMPWALARTVLVPALLPSVSVLSAWPLASVVVLVALSVPPPAVIANVTGTPVNAALSPSCTSTTNGCARAVPDVPCWLSPDTFTKCRRRAVVKFYENTSRL